MRITTISAFAALAVATIAVSAFGFVLNAAIAKSDPALQRLYDELGTMHLQTPPKARPVIEWEAIDRTAKGDRLPLVDRRVDADTVPSQEIVFDNRPMVPEKIEARHTTAPAAAPQRVRHPFGGVSAPFHCFIATCMVI